MSKHKTLIIFDWDDTLFPTYWTIQNNINLNNKQDQNKYMVTFAKLDSILYQIFMKLSKQGQIVIVTNASAKWIIISSGMLPNTQKLLRNDILIVSARDAYQNQYPNQMNIWKKKVFENIASDYFKKKPLQNIISVGDAEYEFNALIDLYDKNSVINRKLLKTVRFKKEPSFDELMDQLDVFNSCSSKIVDSKGHLDLKFLNKN